MRNADGEWEVVQFQTATLIAPGTYVLSKLLRGQGGSEFAMRPSVAAGARFVLFNTAVARVDLAASEIRLPYSWRYGPATRDIGDASYAVAAHTFQGLGLKPLSPVHVRAVRAGGDVAFSWVRRTRLGGDSWETPEVPLGEDNESYEVDILDGAERDAHADRERAGRRLHGGGAGGGLRLGAARLRHPRLPALGRLRPRHRPRRDGVNLSNCHPRACPEDPPYIIELDI